jgi:hypothetical protein
MLGLTIFNIIRSNGLRVSASVCCLYSLLQVKGNVSDVVPDPNPQPHTNNIRAKQVIINYSHLVLLFAFYFTTIYSYHVTLLCYYHEQSSPKLPLQAHEVASTSTCYKLGVLCRG